MADLCFFLILISGSILGAVIADRKFEETIPITSIGIVLLLFGKRSNVSTPNKESRCS